MSELKNNYQPEEIENRNEFDLKETANGLGLVETEEMTHTKSLLIEAIRADNQLERVQLYGEYCDQLEAQIMLEVENFQAQIGGDLAVAAIYKDAGDIGRYVEELGNAFVYAEGMEMVDLADKLKAEIATYQ